MSTIYEAMGPGGHEAYATSIFSKIKTYLDSNPYGYITSYTDTKNTAGSTDTSSKIFLIGATSQAANPQTYSHDTAYVGTDGCLYSGGIKVLTAHQDISGKADKSATVSTVTWSNNKLTKTINGTTSDVVSAATILDNLTSSQVTTALGYTPASVNTTYDFESPDNSISFNGRAVGSVETVSMTVNGKVSTEGDTISGDYVNTADFSEGGVTGKRVTTYGPWGIDIEEYIGTSLWSKLGLRDSDILLTKTWDGTNTSLKSALTNKANKTWTKFGHTTQSSINVSIPQDINEILIIMSFKGTNNAWYVTSFNIPYSQLSSTQLHFTNGWYYSSSDFGSYLIRGTSSSFTFASTTFVGSGTIPYCDFYYR